MINALVCIKYQGAIWLCIQANLSFSFSVSCIVEPKLVLHVNQMFSSWGFGGASITNPQLIIRSCSDLSYSQRSFEHPYKWTINEQFEIQVYVLWSMLNYSPYFKKKKSYSNYSYFILSDNMIQGGTYPASSRWQMANEWWVLTWDMDELALQQRHWPVPLPARWAVLM